MDIIGFIGEITVAIFKHGWSATTLVVFIFALFKFTPFRRMVMRRLPKWLRKIDSNVNDMKSDINRLESKIDALLHAGGVTWNAVETNYTANTEKRSSISSRWARLNARCATKSIMRRNQKMREYLKKLGRTKFQALLVSLVVNIASAVLFISGTIDIDGVINQWMPIINMTVATISTWVYIAVEGSIDKANVQSGPTTFDDTKTH